MKLIMDQKYYDTKELSEMVKLSETTIRKYFNSKKIPALKIGKSWHCTEIDIKKYLNLL